MVNVIPTVLIIAVPHQDSVGFLMNIANVKAALILEPQIQVNSNLCHLGISCFFLKVVCFHFQSLIFFDEDCPRYSVFHNSIATPNFFLNQSNHKN